MAKKNEAGEGAVEGATKVRTKPGEAWPKNFAALYMAAATGQTHTPEEFCCEYHVSRSKAGIPSLHQTVGGLNAKLVELGRSPLPKLKRATRSGTGRINDFIALMNEATTAAE